MTNVSTMWLAVLALVAPVFGQPQNRTTTQRLCSSSRRNLQSSEKLPTNLHLQLTDYDANVPNAGKNVFQWFHWGGAQQEWILQFGAPGACPFASRRVIRHSFEYLRAYDSETQCIVNYKYGKQESGPKHRREPTVGRGHIV